MQVKQKTKNQDAATADDNDDDDEDDDDEVVHMDPADKLRIYKEMSQLMRPGESVLKSLRRLGGGKAGIAASSASRKWKEKRAGNKSASTPDVNRADLLLLTGHADRLLQHGNMEIYQATYEKLVFEVKEMEKVATEAEQEKRTVIPQGTEDDDAMDMFADSIDSKRGDTEVKEKDDTRPAHPGKCVDYASGVHSERGHSISELSPPVQYLN